MKKKILLIMLVGLVFIVGCGQSTTSPAKETTTGTPTLEVPAAGNEPVGEPTANTGNSQSVGEVKEFVMTAKQWEFIPGTIEVNKGDKVKLKITSADVTHGFSIKEFGINKRIEPGETAEVEFTADKTGTFTFYCSVPCGEGHGQMKGQLIVN